jgi:DedD protein
VEQRLKERLIGTAVITALAIIFLPMLIDEKDQRWDPQDSSAKVPPLPDKFKNKPKILSDAGVEDSRLFPAPDKQPYNPDSSSASTSNANKTAQLNAGKKGSPSILKTEVIKKPAVPGKAPPGMDNQLKSLLPGANQKDIQNQSADNVIAPAIPKVLKQTTQPLDEPSVPVPTQVEITPLDQPRKIEVAKYKPATRPKPVKKALYSDLTGLWVVQAGVFKDKTNAEALRKKLSKSGFSAYLEAVNTELGQLIRVRAGRVPKEQTARQMVSTLNKRFGLKSITFPETKWNSKRANK